MNAHLYKSYIRANLVWVGALTALWLITGTAAASRADDPVTWIALVVWLPAFIGFALPYCAAAGGNAVFEKAPADPLFWVKVLGLGCGSAMVAFILMNVGQTLVAASCVALSTCDTVSRVGSPQLFPAAADALGAPIFALMGAFVSGMTAGTVPRAKQDAERWIAFIMLGILYYLLRDLMLAWARDYGLSDPAASSLPVLAAVVLLATLAWARRRRRAQDA